MQDTSSQFHNALYLGDVQERVKILTPFQPSLAYLTAVTHGLQAEADKIAAQYFPGKELPKADPTATLLQPPTAILKVRTHMIHARC